MCVTDGKKKDNKIHVLKNILKFCNLTYGSSINIYSKIVVRKYNSQL